MSLEPGVATSDPPIPPEARRIAVIAPSWVGDAVMATPVLRAMKVHRPAARLMVLARPALAPLLQGLSWIDELGVVDMRGALGAIAAARVLRGVRSEAIVLLPNSFRSGAAAWLSRAPRRIGYRRDGRGPLLTHGLRAARSTSPLPTRDDYLRLGEFALGAAIPDHRMELAVTAEELAEADRLLAGVARPFVLLNPGGVKPAKRWPAARFAEVADALARTHGMAAAVTGSPDERPVTAAVSAAARGSVIDLAARGISLGSLKGVIRRAALLVTNDTGPRHIAAALGTPVISLFGPTDHRWTTIDCPHERILLAEPFLPESLIADRHPRICAIDRITVGDVLSAAQALLSAAASPADGAR
jgi:heptosyltransferase-2